MNNPQLRTRIKKLSLVCIVLAIVFFALAYVFFHHITPEGFTLAKQIIAGKPYVTEMIGVLATIMFAFHIVLEFFVAIVLKKENNNDR